MIDRDKRRRTFLLLTLSLLYCLSLAYDPSACIRCRKSHVCNPPDCFCCRDEMPIKGQKIPQMVFFTFDDAVNPPVAAFYRELFDASRLNPNGCPIKMTLFISHASTVYSLVREFYEKGMEIASHSVNHRNPDPKTFLHEAKKQKENLVNKANIPESEIKGWRSPFLKPLGDIQPEVLKGLGYQYDATLTIIKPNSKDKAPMPFTLDYGWPYDCKIKPCPKKQHKGFWEVPVISVRDYIDKYNCVYIDGCNIPPPSEALAYKFLWDNFENYYKTNRAPMGINMHASWFYYPDRKKAMSRFIQDILKLDDVYIVTVSQVLAWLRNPTPLSSIKAFGPWQCNGNSSAVPPKTVDLRIQTQTQMRPVSPPYQTAPRRQQASVAPVRPVIVITRPTIPPSKPTVIYRQPVPTRTPTRTIVPTALLQKMPNALVRRPAQSNIRHGIVNVQHVHSHGRPQMVNIRPEIHQRISHLLPAAQVPLFPWTRQQFVQRAPSQPPLAPNYPLVRFWWRPPEAQLPHQPPGIHVVRPGQRIVSLQDMQQNMRRYQEIERQRHMNRQQALKRQQIENVQLIKRRQELRRLQTLRQQNEILQRQEIEQQRVEQIKRQEALARRQEQEMKKKLIEQKELERQRQIEMQHQQELARLQEQQAERKLMAQKELERQRQIEMQRQQELARRQELEMEKKLIEQKKLEHQRQIAMQHQQKLEMEKKLIEQKKPERQRQIEIQRQQEVARRRGQEMKQLIKQKKLERQRQIEIQLQQELPRQQEQEMKKLIEQKKLERLRQSEMKQQQKLSHLRSQQLQVRQENELQRQLEIKRQQEKELIRSKETQLRQEKQTQKIAEKAANAQQQQNQIQVNQLFVRNTNRNKVPQEQAGLESQKILQLRQLAESNFLKLQAMESHQKLPTTTKVPRKRATRLSGKTMWQMDTSALKQLNVPWQNWVAESQTSQRINKHVRLGIPQLSEFNIDPQVKIERLPTKRVDLLETLAKFKPQTVFSVSDFKGSKSYSIIGEGNYLNKNKEETITTIEPTTKSTTPSGENTIDGMSTTTTQNPKVNQSEVNRNVTIQLIAEAPPAIVHIYTRKPTTLQLANKTETAPTPNILGNSIQTRTTTETLPTQVTTKPFHKTTKRSRPASFDKTVNNNIIYLSGTCVQGQNCKLPECMCKQFSPPKGLLPPNIPQIVYITIDGNINFHTYSNIKKIFQKKRVNPNGCPIKGTLFATDADSNYMIMKMLHSDGFEIAMKGMKSTSYQSSKTLENDVRLQRRKLEKSGNIPSKDIQGWRSPDLKPLGDKQFEVLGNASLYDSTLIVGKDRKSGEKLWPFTLDYGWRERCEIEACPYGSHPGVWEVPIIKVDDTNNTRSCEYVDSCTNQPYGEQETADFLMDNFNQYYKTNRAPFAIRLQQVWFHWHYTKNLAGLNKFIDEILKLSDVYVVTVSEMLDWMKNPTPQDKIKSFKPWSC